MILRCLSLLFVLLIPFLGSVDFDEDADLFPESWYEEEDAYPLPPGYEYSHAFETEDSSSDCEDCEEDEEEYFFRKPPSKDAVPLEAQELPYFETLPGLMIGGCVNALSGDFIESGIDLVVPGPKPLVIQRSWSSRERQWHFGQSVSE